MFLETSKGPEEDEGSAAGFLATKCDGCLGDSGPIFDHTSLSGKNRAEISMHDNRRSIRPRQIHSSSLSEEEKEHHFDVDVHCRNISSGYSRRYIFFIEKSSMDRCFESSTDSFPRLASCSSGEVPPLCSLDILKPEVNDSRMVCFEDEI